MKFTDGNWMMRSDVQAFYPAQAYEIGTTQDSLLVQAPVSAIRHRGDTLTGPLLTLRFSSPMADVIRVRLSHLADAPDHGPHFPVPLENATELTIREEQDAATLTSGRLSVRGAKGGALGIQFAADGRIITQSGSRGMGLAVVEGEGPYMQEQLALGVGECVYGLGERFTAFVKNGQVVETWNKDGGTGSDQAYKNVPFYLTNRGYGVFVNHPENVSFEVASEKVSRVQFSVAGRTLEYFVIYGPSPKEILKSTRRSLAAPPYPLRGLLGCG